MKFVGIVLTTFLLLAGQALAADSTIRFDETAGIYYIAASLPGSTKPIDFVLDTGAARITVPPETLNGVQKKLLGSSEMYLGGRFRYTVMVYRVPSITIGSCTFNNVEITATITVDRPFLGEQLLRQAEPYTVGSGMFSFHCPTENVASASAP